MLLPAATALGHSLPAGRLRVADLTRGYARLAFIVDALQRLGRLEEAEAYVWLLQASQLTHAGCRFSTA